MVTVLAKLAPGTKFRLFTRYRDGSPRPWFKYGTKPGVRLTAHDLTVAEFSRGVCWVDIGDTGQQAPLWPGLRVLL